MDTYTVRRTDGRDVQCTCKPQITSNNSMLRLTHIGMSFVVIQHSRVGSCVSVKVRCSVEGFTAQVAGKRLYRGVGQFVTSQITGLEIVFMD